MLNWAMIFIAIVGGALGGIAASMYSGRNARSGLVALAGILGSWGLFVGAGVLKLITWETGNPALMVLFSVLSLTNGPIAALTVARGWRARRSMATQPTNVGPRTRMLYGLFDGSVFIAIWVALQAISGAYVPFRVMQSFSPQEYTNYIKVMSWMTLGLFLASLFNHRFFGGSIGKVLAGCRTEMSDGTPITWRAAFLRSVLLFLIGLMIMAPGPLIAFVFGPGSEGYSLLSLAIGIVLLFWMVIWPRYVSNDEVLPSRLEQWCGLRTVDRHE
ncbi:MAG: RDD family protein [Methylobacterium sp.]|nr:RDD family protein [Methylobacterium sp.]